MRILITGAAGFIGSHLWDTFCEHDLMGLDNFETGGNILDEERGGPKGMYGCYVQDRQWLYELANKHEPELVIHCAASYSDPDKWHKDTETNVMGGINAALVARHHGAHLVYFQTILPPVSSYAISKIAAEQYMRLSGVPLTVLRLGNIYGPRNLSGPIPVFYKRIKEGKPCIVVDTTRDMVFIEDLVRCVKTVVENRIEGTFDVCSGEQRSIMDMYRLIATMLKHSEEPPVIPPDPDDVQGTISLDNTLASWKWSEKVGLVEGIARTIASYEESGVEQTHTHLRLGHADD